MIDLQHFPTPKSLAELAWSKFKNRDISRLLEPSAGKGDLILPRKASYNTSSMPSDFDKVFAMLDGKSSPEVSLRGLFDNEQTFADLKIFPRNMEVVERLNRVVGQHRQWLPPSMEEATPDFRRQYDQAEKLHAEVVAESSKVRTEYRDLMWAFARNRDEAQERAAEALDDAIGRVLARHDIHPFDLIDDDRTAHSMLALAA